MTAMKISFYAATITLLFSVFFKSACFANDAITTEARSGSDRNGLTLAASTFTDEMRWTIKREVMSKPGVMLDMANMTDNGYVWTNDVVWIGSGSPENETWYIAGFMFQRPRYESVWLQYAFTLSRNAGKLTNFKRWYGRAAYR